MPAAAVPGTVIPIGLTGRAVFVTSTKPCASAAASKLILYCVGLPVVAVKGKLAVTLPAQIDGLAPNVIVGVVLIVTEIG